MDSVERFGERISIGRSRWQPGSIPASCGSTSFWTCHSMFPLVPPNNQVSVPNSVKRGSRHSPRPRSSTWPSSTRHPLAGAAMNDGQREDFEPRETDRQPDEPAHHSRIWNSGMLWEVGLILLVTLVRVFCGWYF